MVHAEIAVIIVNYNTCDLTIGAVNSVLERSHGGRRVEVHVVDNGSPGDDAARLSEALSEPVADARVLLHCEAENHGFGRANNIVLRQLTQRTVPPRYVLLLNPDALLDNDAAAVLADFLDTHPTVTGVGARIAKPDGTPSTAAFRFPSVIGALEASFALGALSRLLSCWRVPLPANIQTGRVDWVSGAAVMFRLSELARVQFFDPDYFLYYEEVDLMYRIKQAAGEIWYVAEARVIHHEGASTGVRSNESIRRRRPAYWYQSWQLYFLKNRGRLIALAAAAAWVSGAACNHVISAVRGRAPAAPRHFFRDFWSVSVRPLLGLKALPYE